MAALGMLVLGAFVGYIVTFGLVKIEDWTKPIATVTGVLSAGVAGGLFTLIDQHAGKGAIGEAIFYYPVGLGYGALCTNLRWVTREGKRWLQYLHVGAFTAASVALFLLMVWPAMRDRLPKPGPAAATAPAANAPSSNSSATR